MSFEVFAWLKSLLRKLNPNQARKGKVDIEITDIPDGQPVAVKVEIGEARRNKGGDIDKHG